MSKITKAQVTKAIRAAISRTPDAINPDDDFTCVYHQGRGKNVRRCIIGQIGHDLCLPQPDAQAAGVESLCGVGDYYEDETDGGLWLDRFTPGAIELMAKAQRFADATHVDGARLTRRRPWREIRSIL